MYCTRFFDVMAYQNDKSAILINEFKAAQTILSRRT